MVGCFRGEMRVSGSRLELVSLGDAADWEPWLSNDEARRAAGMSNVVLRARFVVSRGLRRKVIAEVLDRQSSELQFIEDQGTKPRLGNGDGWDFNLSHAGDYVALVLARGQVGVDLEEIRPVREMESLVGRYFHPDEAGAWGALHLADQEQAFFVLWSAREAAMKCAGTGLARGLGQTRVDPAILRQSSARGDVGTKEMILQREDAPEGYSLVTARMVS